MEEMLNLIGNVGFPIAVSAYLLIRIEGKLTSLNQAINELREAIIMLPQKTYLPPQQTLLHSYNQNPKDSPN